jgi:peptide/nickel transport system permease protein
MEAENRLAVQVVRERTSRKQFRKWLHTLRTNPLGAVGLAVIVVFVAIAFAPQLFATHEPLAIDPANRLQPVSRDHLFGTDELGRDLFSRLVYGSRISIASAVTVVAIAAMIGSTLGLLAGYFGGYLDELIMRVSDIFIAFPTLILAMAMVAVLGPSLTNAMAAVIFAWWPQFARLARSQVLSLKQMAFVESARATGCTDMRIIRKHVTPNSLSVLMVKASLDVGTAVLITSSLSFLGMGVRPPTPELGMMVTQGREFLLSAWWYSTFPGVAIFLLVFGFNLVGDTLRDILDPTLRGR